MTSNDADLLPRLRHSTGPLHDRIEALLQLEAPMPLARYGRILRGFHEFLQLWEQRVRFALPADLRPWFDERRRAALALQDLQDLSIPEAPDLRQSARDAQALIRMDSPAVAIGALYVIEGSALGGQVLVPQLMRHLGLRPDHGARYFHGFGDRTGALWREFRQLAQQQVGPSEPAIADALRGAAQTFEALLQTFAVLEARPLPSSTQDADSRASQALV
ncbi:biliverdin-producing heme oxygenase [Roseateles depolymerans]|uniref:Putative bacteriophytochrome heme oxygenase n=1 Tax=Roseateles depolymerans TaxID=76731 RepID=A0A0U3MW86_9BURK|nr:biliverdin-producing heme oxygenase [Roseateles depolymerans]ALV07283.1 putative bacteriophytochrome heme oxygenase [Roseateles depolymerans]REG20266.1 heme oxygenase [Roseateles depolymerans]